MAIIFSTLFIFFGIICIMGIVIESVNLYYNLKRRFINED